MRPRIHALVSTVITVHNRPALLAEAVNSVLAQTYRPIEILIVDDGSTDDTTGVARAFAAANPSVVRVIRKAGNEGYARATNSGLQHVRGEFVQLLDSDDVLMPEKFERQVAGLRDHPFSDISYCLAREYALGEPAVDRASRRTAEVLPRLAPAIFSGKIWPTAAPLYRRSLIDSVGVYLESAVYPEWEYDCRAARRNVQLHHCPHFLADVRGTHRQEGRTKGGIPPAKLRDYAAIVEHVISHAQAVGVPADVRESLSRRALGAARMCERAGLGLESARCEALGRQTASRRGALMLALRGGGRWPQQQLALWTHRARAARTLLRGERVSRWPALLVQGWRNRSSRLGHRSTA